MISNLFLYLMNNENTTFVNSIGGVIASMLTSSAVDLGSSPGPVIPQTIKWYL